MKKIVSLVALLFVTHSISAQQGLSKEDYLEKSKKQKTIGKILLGTGGALMLTGMLLIIDDAGNIFEQGDKEKGSLADILGSTGGVMAIASIPLFIAAGKNKKNAMSISFKNETAPQLQKGSLVYRHIPSLTFKFHL